MKILIALSLSLSIVLPASAQDWQPLLKGKLSKNWEVRNGTAEYHLEGDSVVVGVAKLNTPNTFLCTKETYSDFIFETEVWLDNQMNSGIQFRSNSLQAYRNGRVHGYQCELDDKPHRRWSGGIYDEGRRGWIYPLSRNPKAQDALIYGQWNHVRIEALGNELRTYINGQMCSNLVDDMTAEGFIGLQVHSIHKPEQVGAEMRWKNPRILTEAVATHRWMPDPDVPEISYLKNQLTPREQREGWRLLWDGQTSKGWIGAKLDHFPEKGWKIEDGILTILATDGGESTGPGDIITEGLYSDFELSLEFMYTEGANSGIKYFVDAELNKGPGSAIGCEFQILDDDKHPDAKMGTAGNRTVGSLYDLITARNLSQPGFGNKRDNGPNKWNYARIVVRDGHVEHWLNNIKVVEYDRHSQMFRALVAYSKYAKWEGFGTWAQGHILLQDHGDTVHYRSIKIREF